MRDCPGPTIGHRLRGMRLNSVKTGDGHLAYTSLRSVATFTATLQIQLDDTPHTHDIDSSSLPVI